jgi:hypothetical protein
MNIEDTHTGIRVKTLPLLVDLAASAISGEQLGDRRGNSQGVVEGFVPGHRGDLWTVRHDDGATGAYHHDEFNELRGASLPLGFRS